MTLPALKQSYSGWPPLLPGDDRRGVGFDAGKEDPIYGSAVDTDGGF